jgi:hypothetical protein
MTDQTHDALDRLMDDVPIGSAPIGALLTAGRAAKRRRRRSLVGGAVAASALVLGGGAMASQVLTATGGSPPDGTVANVPSGTPTEVASGNRRPPLDRLDGTWTVQALVGADGRSALPTTYRGKVQVTFNDGELMGTTGCNDIFGTYQHDGQDIHFPRGDLGTTLVGCDDEPPLLERLQHVRHISQGEDATSLILHADDWMIVAVLEPAAAAPAPSSDSSRRQSVEDGRTRHLLTTHCGVRSTTVDGRLWLATPPLGDDSGNPPQGWDENQAAGWFQETSPTTATFTTDSGQIATFRLAKPGETDPSSGCE